MKEGKDQKTTLHGDGCDTLSGRQEIRSTVHRQELTARKGQSRQNRRNSAQKAYLRSRTQLDQLWVRSAFFADVQQEIKTFSARQGETSDGDGPLTEVETRGTAREGQDQLGNHYHHIHSYVHPSLEEENDVVAAFPESKERFLDRKDPGGESSGAEKSHRRVGPVLSGRSCALLMERFEGLDSGPHRELLAHCLFSTALHVSEDAGGHVYRRVKLASGVLARIQGRESEYKARNYKALNFLRQHREILPRFRWTGWEKGKYPRQAKHHGLTDEGIACLLEDLRTPLSRLEKPTNFCNLERMPAPGEGLGARLYKNRRKEHRTTAVSRSEQAMCELQETLLATLNSYDSRVYTRLANANVEAAIETCDAIKDVSERLRVLMQLRHLQYQPQPFYAPSKRRATVRIFAVGRSIGSLPQHIRKAWLGGCSQFDLANAQLACAARAWEVGPLLDHLGQHGSIWPLLLNIVRGTHGHTDAEAKDYLKTAIYAIVFGMRVHSVRWSLSRNLSHDAAAKVMEYPLIQSLLVARQRALVNIDAAGVAVDCFGIPYAITAQPSKERTPQVRSALASVMQALELQLLEPVIEEAAREAAREKPEFQIVSWLHDGFTVKASRYPERVARRLQTRVDNHAAALGIPTYLELESLGDCRGDAAEELHRSVIQRPSLSLYTGDRPPVGHHAHNYNERRPANPFKP